MMDAKARGLMPLTVAVVNLLPLARWRWLQPAVQVDVFQTIGSPPGPPVNASASLYQTMDQALHQRLFRFSSNLFLR